MSRAADDALSAFRRVVAAISSMDADVCSSAAACSVAPCDSDCEPVETSPEIAFTCAVPVRNVPITPTRLRSMAVAIQTPRRAKIAIEITETDTISHFSWLTEASASLASTDTSVRQPRPAYPSAPAEAA